MTAGKTHLSPILWMLILALVFIGRQLQTQKLPTRAEDSPGFGLLEEARQLKVEKKFPEGYAKAIEASEIFSQGADWLHWGESFEMAFQCTFKSNSATLYSQLLDRLTPAAQQLSVLKDPPAKTSAIIWGRLGSIQQFLGAYEQGITLYQKALPFAETAGDSSLLIRFYANSAIMMWALGDDYRALHYHEKALSIATAIHDTLIIGPILTNLGNVWRTIDPAKSIDIYLQALALRPNDSETLMLLSKGYLEGNISLEKALQTAEKSWRYAEDDAEKSDALHQLGRVYEGLKNYDKSLSYYNQALVFAEIGYGKHHPECAKIHSYRGTVLVKKGDFQQALNAYNQILGDLLPLFKPDNGDQNPTEAEMTTTSVWIWDALFHKSLAYKKRYNQQHQPADLERALACSELALRYQNKIKLRYSDDESKFSISQYYSPSCDAALHNAFTLYNLDGSLQYAKRAFQISEQSKAVVLAEALFKKDMKKVANVPATMLEQERQLQEQIAYFESKLTESDEPNLINTYKDSLFLETRKLEKLEQQTIRDYPAYGDALFNYRSEVSIDSIQQHLPDDTALIEYFLGDSAVYTFLLTKDTFWGQEQALPKSFDQAATDFLRTVNDWRFVADSSSLANSIFLENSHKLYQWLLEKPLAISKARRLFIVPDGKLSLLPFELLLTQAYKGQWIDRDVPFLMKDRAVSYRFSSRIQAPNRAVPQDGWGGFGLQYNDGSLSAINEQNSVAGLRNFGPLPFASEEIMAINGVLGGAFWLNKDATRDNFLKNAERYGILHLAMHGVVDERNPLRSRLLFDNSVAGSDPFVYASDLYNLQLKAGLSVLSACQTGTGVWKKGEGVISLARAFSFAGCPSVVMSLWNVSDQSTSDLMVSFYKHLKDGDTKDEALRQAKLNYLKTVSPEYAKPIYWAAFVPIGEMDSMSDAYFSSSQPWLSIFYGAVVFMLLAAVVYWRRRKRGKITRK